MAVRQEFALSFAAIALVSVLAEREESKKIRLAVARRSFQELQARGWEPTE
jgi:hypothetical protein